MCSRAVHPPAACISRHSCGLLLPSMHPSAQSVHDIEPTTQAAENVAPEAAPRARSMHGTHRLMHWEAEDAGILRAREHLGAVGARREAQQGGGVLEAASGAAGDIVPQQQRAVRAARREARRGVQHRDGRHGPRVALQRK